MNKVKVTSAIAAAIASGAVYLYTQRPDYSRSIGWGLDKPARISCAEGVALFRKPVMDAVKLKSTSSGGAYCDYVVCWDAASNSVARGEGEISRGLTGSIEVGTGAAVPYVDGMPRLQVWCPGAKDAPARCACQPTKRVATKCEWLAPGDVWMKGPTGFTYAKGRWRGDCEPTACVELMGQESAFAPACR